MDDEQYSKPASTDSYTTPVKTTTTAPKSPNGVDGLFSTESPPVTKSKTAIPIGWTKSQEDAYLKLNTDKSSMTTDLVRKALKGKHGDKPSENHQKAHKMDCEMVIEALKSISGPIPGRQYFADIADSLCECENWRWLKDVKNRPPAGDETYVNDYDIVQKLLSGKKTVFSGHEKAKVKMHVDWILKHKDILPRAFIESLASLYDVAYDENNHKIFDKRKLGNNTGRSTQKEGVTKGGDCKTTGLKNDGTPDLRTVKGKEMAGRAAFDLETKFGTSPPKPPVTSGGDCKTAGLKNDDTPGLRSVKEKAAFINQKEATATSSKTTVGSSKGTDSYTTPTSTPIKTTTTVPMSPNGVDGLFSSTKPLPKTSSDDRKETGLKNDGTPDYRTAKGKEMAGRSAHILETIF